MEGAERSSSNNAKDISCAICGLDGGKLCGKCKNTRYCSKEHQIYHWNTGLHKELCCESDLSSKKAQDLQKADQRKIDTCLYPMYEIISEKDQYEEKEVEEMGDMSNALVPSISNLSVDDDNEKIGEWEEEEFEESSADVDKTFLKFQKRIEHDPDQILR